MHGISTSGLAFAGISVLACGLARGAAVQIEVVGFVVSSDVAGFDLGQSMTAMIEYESAGGPDRSLPPTFSWFDNRLTGVSFTSGGWNTSDTGQFGEIVFANNVDPLPSDSMAINVSVDGSGYSSGTTAANADLSGFGGTDLLAVAFVFGSNTADSWDGLSLPGSFDPTTFASGLAAANLRFSAGNVEVRWETFNGVLIPAPGSLAIVGLFGMALGGRRRPS
jgi:hypothetical protein